MVIVQAAVAGDAGPFRAGGTFTGPAGVPGNVGPGLTGRRGPVTAHRLPANQDGKAGR